MRVRQRLVANLHLARFFFFSFHSIMVLACTDSRCAHCYEQGLALSLLFGVTSGRGERQREREGERERERERGSMAA